MGIPLRWKGQAFDVEGVVGTSERHAILIGATLPPRRKASKKFIPRLVLQQYDMATGKAQNLSFAVPVAADWKLQFVRVVNRDKWVMGVQKDAANEQAENAVLIVCQNQHCGGLNGTRLYFDKAKRETPEDHFLAREQDRLVWMRVGQGESERLQGFSYQLKSVATKGKKVPSYEVIAEPKVTLPQLQSGSFWPATEMMQDRVVYVMQDPSDLAHVRLGCVELADQKPCEGSSGGYFLVGLAEPQEIRNVSISLSGDGELVLRVVGRVVGGVGGMRLSHFAVALPATRAQLRLVEHPEETVLWWRNVGPQDKPPPSLLVTGGPEALVSLSGEMQERLREEGDSYFRHTTTVPAWILKAWGEAILTRRELDRPVVTADQVRGFYVYGLTLCQGSRCWDRIPGSRGEISAWADMLLQGIPKEDLPRLRQVIQNIRAIAGSTPST